MHSHKLEMHISGWWFVEAAMLNTMDDMALSLNYASAGSLLGFGCLPLTLGVKPHCGRIRYSIRPKSPVMSFV